MSPFPGAPPISLPGGYTAKQVSAALLCYGAKNCTMHTLLTMTCRLLKVYVQCAHFVVLTLPGYFWHTSCYFLHSHSDSHSEVSQCQTAMIFRSSKRPPPDVKAYFRSPWFCSALLFLPARCSQAANLASPFLSSIFYGLRGNGANLLI